MYAYIFVNDAFSLFHLYNISNIVINIKVHDYIKQKTFQILSIMNSPIVVQSSLFELLHTWLENM